MNQSDIDLIYDYLHENYEYKEGELIRIKSSNGHLIGKKLGSFSFNDKWKSPCVKAVVSINKRKISSTLAHLMWIFFYKKKPNYIEFVDGNVTNLRIENLKEIDVTAQYLKNTEKSKGVTKIVNGNGTFWRACIAKNRKIIFLGHHKTIDTANEAYKTGREAISIGLTCNLEIKKYVYDKLGIDRDKLSNNKNGFKGIKKSKSGSYYGYSTRKGYEILTPCFKTPAEAHEAYLNAKEKFNE